MKKLIATLVIAIVLVGAVFADTTAPAVDDNGQLTVKTEIKIQYPVYSLKATGWSTTTGTRGANASLGNASSVVASPTAQDVVIGDNELVDHNVIVEFTIYQTTLSRIKGTYTLEVEATPLVIKKITKPDGTKTVVANITDAEEKAAILANNVFSLATGSESPEISANTVAHTDMDVDTDGQIAITYDGMKVGSNSTDTALATFECTWEKNEDAAAGDYEATVTLTITNIS